MRKFDGNCTEGRKDKERKKERKREGKARDQEMERRTKWGRQEIMCKRLSSRTHDPGDRIQIYWFLAYASKRRRKREREREKRVEFEGPFGVNGSHGFYDLDSGATRASVSFFHGLLICLQSVNTRRRRKTMHLRTFVFSKISCGINLPEDSSIRCTRDDERYRITSIFFSSSERWINKAQ